MRRSPLRAIRDFNADRDMEYARDCARTVRQDWKTFRGALGEGYSGENKASLFIYLPSVISVALATTR